MSVSYTHLGLTTWAAAPEGKIVKSDVSVAKNYLSEQEMRSLERIVSAYLDLAEDRAERHIPMTMEDWAKMCIRDRARGYQVEKCTAVDQFCQTVHVETVVMPVSYTQLIKT